MLYVICGAEDGTIHAMWLFTVLIKNFPTILKLPCPHPLPYRRACDISYTSEKAL